MAIFGQPPLAAYLPLSAGQNLADVPDKAAALSNLGTLSSSDIMMNSVPIGTVIAYWGSSAPLGYLPCNGQTVNSATYPDLVTFLGGGASRPLPDLRGEFLRGWDNGRGIDSGRTNLSVQTDALQNITGSFVSLNSSLGQSHSGAFVGTGSSAYPIGTGATTSGITNVNFSAANVARTANETRPHNVTVLYCMKAYGALINTATANMANVLSELSNTTKLTQFGVSLSTNGYQRLPGGLIIQWGVTPIMSPSTTAVITYPIAFSTAVLSVTATGGTNSASFGPLGIDLTPGLATFNLWSNTGGTLAGRFIAIGY